MLFLTLTNYPGPVLALGLLLGTAVLMALAYRTRKTAEIRYGRWVLGGLQYLVIVLLLIILWNPSVPTFTSQTSKNMVWVFFDTSRSMSVVEAEEKDRLDQAMVLFQQHFAPGHPARPQYQIFGFDTHSYRCESFASLHRWGDRTNLRELIEALNHNPKLAEPPEPRIDSQGDHVVGAVIFTDGQADDKRITSYVSLPHPDWKVVWIGMGTAASQKDLAIDSLEAPPRVVIDTSYLVTVQIRGVGLAEGDRLTVELSQDEQLIAVQELTYRERESNSPLEFRVGAHSLGSHWITARVVGETKEINLANNSRRTTVEVVENPRRRVLFYSQVANFDFGKIRSALERDQKIQLEVGLDVVLSAETNRRVESFAVSHKVLPGHIELPKTKSDFYQYDLILLGPCNLDGLPETQIEGLYSFVVDRGGGLILLPGRSSYGFGTCKNERIQALLPVEVNPGEKDREQQEGTDLVQLTPAGLESGIFPESYLNLPGMNLQRVPDPITLFYGTLSKKPAATILASAQQTPLLCVHRVGRGHVCLINASGLFRWYREDEEGGLLQQLMSGLTSYLARVSVREAGMELFVRRDPEDPSTVRFDADLFDRHFSRVSGASVLLSVGEQTIRMDEMETGRYTTAIENYTEESVVATAEAEVQGVFLGEKRIAVTLPLPKGEMDRIERDRRFLQELAEKSQARYVDAENIPADIADTFAATSTIRRAGQMQSIWARWPLLIVMCLLLTSVWFIRRAKGLL